MLRTLIILLLSLNMTLSFAQGGIEQEFKQKLESVSRNNKMIRCDFTQTKKVKNIKQPISGKGEFFYDNSGLMALVYTEPKGDKVVMNGEEFTILTSGKKLVSTASSNPMMSQISFMMQACMSGDISKLGQGLGMSVERDSEGYNVRLTPTDRRIKKYITGMVMNFDTTNLTLNLLRIDETSGGYTEYRFSNKKLNQKIDKSYFKVE